MKIQWACIVPVYCQCHGYPMGIHGFADCPRMPMPWISNGYPLSQSCPSPHCPSLPWRLSKIEDCPRIPRCPSLPRDANAMKIQWVCIVPVHFTLSHAVPVCLEGWRLSRIPVYPGMPMPWISNGLQIAPVHPEDRIPHCPSHANAMDIQWVSMDLQTLSQSTQGCQCHEYPMGIHCPSPAPVHTVPVCLEGCLRSKIVPGFHAVPVYPGMPMPWRSNGYALSQSTANAMDIQWVSMDLQIAPVHPEDRIPHCPSLPWRVSKIQDCPRIPAVPVYAGMPNAMNIRWVSIQCHEYPMGIHCPSPPPVHTVPVCLEGCLRSKIVPGFHAVPVYPGMPMPWRSMGMDCPSPFHTVPRCPSLPWRVKIVQDHSLLPIPWISNWYLQIAPVPPWTTLSQSALKGV